MGGMDIFKSIFNAETNTWSEPENIGYPVNTADEDAFFVISASGKHGYYMSSAQEDNKGLRDLYMITFLGPDNEANVVIATFKSNSKTGKYLVSLPAGKNYGIAVKKEGYLFHSENFDIPNTSAFQTVEKNVELKMLSVGSKIVLRNIFFDLDKATLRNESTAELNRLIKLMNDLS